MVSLSLLNSLARRTEKVDDAPRTGLSDLVLEISRGVPYNPTTEMDLDLWRIASLIRTDAETMRAYDTEGSAVIARRYSAGSLQKKTRQAIAAFLDRYGARGLAEIDTGRPRWRDEPQHIFEIVGAYLGITDPERSPETIFARSAEQAQAAVRRLEHLARTSSSGIRGRARAARVRFAARRAREFLGFREYPKFFFVRVMDIFRGRLKTLGEELAHDGTIEDSDDLFSLTLSELRDFGSAVLTATDARRLVAKRRDDYRRELMRRQIPRLLLSDGRAFYEGISAAPHASGASTDDLSSGLDEWLGSPVSPGSVEGEVRVVLDPRSSGLEPGEIMVCPGTDPSWTPLFLIAGGLIMEVGGMMTHGAVVAREYGIPAVVGVHEATGRLQTGTRIRLDGSSGRITPLDRRP
jgi:pyruvate,water dikinase